MYVNYFSVKLRGKQEKNKETLKNENKETVKRKHHPWEDLGEVRSSYNKEQVQRPWGEHRLCVVQGQRQQG